MATIPTITYTGRDFASIKAELSAFVQATRPDDWTDFFESSLGEALIDLLSYSHDVLSYGQDAMAHEIFLDTVRRYESALRFAKSVGYVPQTAIASSAVVTGTLSGSALTSGVVFTAGQTITGTNGLKYELTEDAVITANTSTANITLYQGTTKTEYFEPTQVTNQSFTMTTGVVANDSWSIFVGDPTNASNKWSQVDSVSFETSDTNTYEVDYNEDGRLIVTFGDGTAGKIPRSTVTVIYRVCDGADGNANASTVVGTLSGTLIGGTAVASVTFTNLTSASGGQDRESVATMRKSIPTFLRTVDKVITLDDYEKTIPIQTSTALCFAEVPLASSSGNIVRVNIWDTQPEDFVATSLGSGRASTVAYSKYAQAPSTRAYEVHEYLKTRTIATVHNVITRPIVSQVSLQFSKIGYDSNFDVETVHADIAASVVSVFESGTGFSMYLSDLYAAILGVSGVKSATISQIVWTHFDYTTPGNGIITETFTADGTLSGPLKDLVVPGVDNRRYYDDSNLFTGDITYQGSIDAASIEAITLTTLNFELTTE